VNPQGLGGRKKNVLEALVRDWDCDEVFAASAVEKASTLIEYSDIESEEDFEDLVSSIYDNQEYWE
jgi:SepF-like predicted cell division protein (DUF552 family)